MTADAPNVLDRLDPELWIVTAADGPRRGGLIATFVSRASIVPEMPRVLVGLSVRHFTRELVEASGAFALHLIGEEHAEWVWRFGLQSGRTADKLASLNVSVGTTGSPLLDDAPALLDCRVEARYETGDRTVYLAEVVSERTSGGFQPLRMSRLLKLALPEQRRELKSQLDRDALRDAELIATWRETVGG